MSEPDWLEVRRRARRRSGAVLALIVSPALLLIAAVKILERHAYPAGDMRNDPQFWLVVALVMLVFVGALVVGSIRVLRER
jgi:hypothetical protein